MQRGDRHGRQQHREGEAFCGISQGMFAAFIEDAVTIIAALILVVPAR
jgi:hypothetical protein